MKSRSQLAALVLAPLLGLAAAAAQDSAVSEVGASTTPPPASSTLRLDDLEHASAARLRTEIRALLNEINTLRHDLAGAQLEASRTRSELEELRQFMADHHEYGQDFEQYTALRELREEEARQKRIEEARQRREAERERRAAERARRLAERDARKRESEEESRYTRRGFSPLGLDVYNSRMAFAYPTTSIDQPYLAYDVCVGFYNARDTRTEIDYSRMTISGSILNGHDDVRNIGVALTFFDENNNQVGHEIVQINNARPDVPYPFTSTIDMALNRPFHSSSVYVLYADPTATPQAPTTSSTTGTATQPTDNGN